MNSADVPLVLTLSTGKGRDFVVGDIHGCFDLLEHALSLVRFNPQKDRLFSVGDLIDRGPYSPRVLEFLRKPWFHAVRGNHEQMLLELYQDGSPSAAELERQYDYMGMLWWDRVPPADRTAILQALRKLPLAIEIQGGNHTTGIIHADVPKGLSWQDFVAKLLSGDDRTINTCQWGRGRATRMDFSGVKGITEVFAGHTVHESGIGMYGNVSIIDTGAGYPAGQLSLVQLGYPDTERQLPKIVGDVALYMHKPAFKLF